MTEYYAEPVFYQSTEVVRAIGETETDILIESQENYRTYEVDKALFAQRYAPVFDVDAYSQLKMMIAKQNEDMKHLRRANSRLKDDNRRLRREREKARKQAPERQHYKNGKRGTVKNGG